MCSTRRDGYSALPREPRGTGGLRWELLRVPWRKGRWKQGTGTGVGNVDKNVTSTPFFESASGEKITETGEAGAGDDGVFIVFRTSEFSESEPVTVQKDSNLHAKGSWAVAAK